MAHASGVAAKAQPRRSRSCSRSRPIPSGWSRREPGAAGRQRHRLRLLRSRAVSKTAGAAARARAQAPRIAVLVNPSAAIAPQVQLPGRRKARPTHRSGTPIRQRRDRVSEIDTAFATLAQRAAGALSWSAPIRSSTPPRTDRRLSRPAIASRNLSFRDIRRGRRPDQLRRQHCRRVPPGRHYVGRILKGAKPADLPVSSRPSSSWSSTSRPPRRSASRCRRRCSPAPTR